MSVFEFTRTEVADTLGIHKRTVGKVVDGCVKTYGHLPPGVSGDRRVYTDRFVDWFRARPDARPELQGIKRDGSVKRPMDKPAQAAHVTPLVTGLTAEYRAPDVDEIWKRAIDLEKRGVTKNVSRYDQWVDIPDDKPVLLGLLTDPHLGNSHCAYSEVRRVAELVRDTDGMYGGVFGDCIDNWVSLNPKLLGIQREQPMQHADELALLDSWLGIMRDKLVVAVAGNHDLRTYDIAGVDLIQRALGKAKVLYDQYEVRFSLRLGKAVWRFKVRHNWPGRSQLVDAYAMLKDSKFNDGSWQIGVGGHTHASTTFCEFVDKSHDNQLKLAVQLGSFELDSAYARKLNLPRSVMGGAAAIMFWPDGSYQPWRNLDAAVRFLAAERAR